MAEDVQKYLCVLETEIIEEILVYPVILHSTAKYKE